MKSHDFTKKLSCHSRNQDETKDFLIFQNPLDFAHHTAIYSGQTAVVYLL